MDRIAPTVTLEALDDKGATDAAVKVTLDGQVVAQKLDGSALDVEPGDHTFVFERASDGKKLEQKILISEGEKDRKIVADYQTLLPPKPPPPPAPRRSRAEEVPLLAYVAGGVALAGLSVVHRVRDQRTRQGRAISSHSCSPHCTPSQVSPIEARLRHWRRLARHRHLRASSRPSSSRSPRSPSIVFAGRARAGAVDADAHSRRIRRDRTK